MVAGKKQRHLYNAEYEAARAAKLLARAVSMAVEVTGVVVVVNPKSMTIREKPSGVVVVIGRQLLRWLSRSPGSWIIALLIGAPLLLLTFSAHF